VKATQNFAGDVRKTKKKLTWLADTPDLVDVELIDLDMMITKDKPEEEDKVEDLITPNSYRAHKARGEAALRTLKKGETIQVERRGFYVCDEPYVRPADPIRFFFVPDGKKFFGF
jgi:glutamyl-tRNA synthetase